MDQRAIGYASADSRLGPILLAATPRGVCHVRFGSGVAELTAGLRDEFPCAVLRREERGHTRRWLRAVVAYVDGERTRLDLPLDVAGSRFERRVWAALRDIPRGRTRAYSELAAQLGSGARAVARACAANPVPIVVPCHRVIGRDGALRGYRYGIERKRLLLEREGVGSATPPRPRTRRPRRTVRPGPAPAAPV